MGYLSCRKGSATATLDSTQKRQTSRTDLRHFRYEDLELATAGFSPASLLGKGSHGCVYKAVLDSGKLAVAVKRFTPETHPNDDPGSCHSNTNNYNNSINPNENEIEILSRIRNRRFVNLLGFSDLNGEKSLLVVEFMPNGTLYHQLHASPRSPGWARRVRFALQIAKAIEALHASDPPVIHRDVKSSNVLIDEKWNARLGDFGLALRGHVEDERLRSTPPAGTLGYLDPVYVTPENLSTKSDVFSFGILLLEMISGRNAIDVNYSTVSLVEWAVPLIKKGELNRLFDPRLRPPEELMGRRLAGLAGRCVGRGVEERPPMREVVGCLKRVRKRGWSNVASWLKSGKVWNVQRAGDHCQRN